MKYFGYYTIIIVLLFVGCETSNFVKMESDNYLDPTKSYSVQVPLNWKKYKRVKDSTFVITRDGLLLQSISLELKSIKSAFPHTNRKIVENMMPQELSELFIDDLKSNNELFNLEVISNEPASISGENGFRFEYKHRTENG